MILGVGGADELETEHISVGSRLGPHDLRVFDGMVVGRRADPERADLSYRDAHVHRHAETADAGVESQPRATHGSEQVDLGIEGPTTRPTTSASVDGDICATLRKYRRESVGNGHQDIAKHIEAPDPWLAFSTSSWSNSTSRAPFGGTHSR
jgi:hypothetical protein